MRILTMKIWLKARLEVIRTYWGMEVHSRSTMFLATKVSCHREFIGHIPIVILLHPMYSLLTLLTSVYLTLFLKFLKSQGLINPTTITGHSFVPDHPTGYKLTLWTGYS